jgi:competence protein ComFC
MVRPGTVTVTCIGAAYRGLCLLLDLFTPARCVGCDRPVSFRDNHLCGACRNGIVFLSGSCPVCSGELLDGTCEACRERHWYFDKNLAVAEYSGIIKNVIAGLKFRKIRGLHAVLGSLALKKLGRYPHRASIITWVPMNTKKKWDRGFNQSELIARYLSRRTGIPCGNLLRETRKSGTQRNLGLRNRFINTLGRYMAVPGAMPNGASVLLVDDVFTTGATINECARQLREAGAMEVLSLTTARADTKKLEKF